MASILPTSVPSKTLAQSIDGSTLAMVLNNILGWDGNALTSADLGTKAYAVFRNSAGTLMEIVEYDPSTIANASITILARGLKFTGDLTTSVAANKLTWVKGDTIVELGTHVPQLLKHYIDDIADQTISGVKTFGSADAARPRIDSDTDTAVATAFVTLGQLSRQAISGASNASTTVKGIVEMATQAEVEAGTSAGGTGALLVVPAANNGARFNAGYAADSVGTDAYAITLAPVPSAYFTGMVVNFKAGTVNTGACTLNVNALGAKAIKYNGADPVDSIISSGAFVSVIYDGTNFNILSVTSGINVVQNPTGIISPYAGRTAPTGWLLCDGTAVSRTTYAGLLAILAPTIGVVTISNATPAVISLTSHGLVVGDTIYFTTTGGLPTGLSINTLYYVITAGFGANSFQVSATRGGAAINTSSAGSGTHTMVFCPYGLGDGTTTFNTPDLRARVPFGYKAGDTYHPNMGFNTGGEQTHVLTVAELASHNHNWSGSSNSAGGASVVPTNNGLGGVIASPSAGSDTAHNNMPPFVTTQYIIKY